jgi:hypothetical protein
VSGVYYAHKKDCLNGVSTSSWNANPVTIENVTDARTVTPPGSLSIPRTKTSIPAPLPMWDFGEPSQADKVMCHQNLWVLYATLMA